MRTKSDVLQAEDAAWHTLCDRFGKLAETDFDTPGVNGDWTPKDLMAHVAVWHAETTDRFENLRTTGRLPEVPDVDAFNEDSYRRCKDVSLPDVRAMFESSRHRFREEIAAMDEPLDERVVQIIAANGHEHYQEHIPQLEAFIERR